MGKNTSGYNTPYNQVRTNFDIIMESFKTGNSEDDEDNEDEDAEEEVGLKSSTTEVMVIVDERIEESFAPELDRVVRVPFLSPNCH